MLARSNARRPARSRAEAEVAAELESERLRLAEAGERKQAALDDATARFARRDLMAQSHASAIRGAGGHWGAPAQS